MLKPDPFIHQILIDGAAPTLFDVDDRLVVCFDLSHGLLFSNGEWRVATTTLIRKAHLDGYPLGIKSFGGQFPKAASTAVPMWLVLQAMDQPRPRQKGTSTYESKG